MRVLHVVEATVGGVRTHVHALVSGLAQRQIESVVACPPCRYHAFGDEQFVRDVRRAGIAVVPVALRRPISPLIDAVAVGQLIALLRQQPFDVIHLHSSKAGGVGRLAARCAPGAAVVYSPHGLYFLGDHPPLKRWGYRVLEQLGGRLCDAVIATSASEHAILLANRIVPPARAIQIDYGINPDPLPPSFDRAAYRRALGLQPDDLVIGTLARAAAQKNPLLFVEAAALVWQSCPQARFVWCGGGPLLEAATARAQALGIAERCLFLGHREDAQAVLATFDLFWLTSDYESFGLATAEAMAHGCPVVATDAPGTCSVVEHGRTGLLVAPRDPQALAAATLGLLAEPARMRAFGLAGRQRVLDHFATDRMVDATAQLYTRLVSARQRVRLPQQVRAGG